MVRNRALAKRLARTIDLLETKIEASKERGAIKLAARDADELHDVLRNAFLFVTDASYDSLAGSIIRVMGGEDGDQDAKR